MKTKMLDLDTLWATVSYTCATYMASWKWPSVKNGRGRKKIPDDSSDDLISYRSALDIMPLCTKEDETPWGTPSALTPTLDFSSEGETVAAIRESLEYNTAWMSPSEGPSTVSAVNMKGEPDVKALCNYQAVGKETGQLISALMNLQQQQFQQNQNISEILKIISGMQQTQQEWQRQQWEIQNWQQQWQQWQEQQQQHQQQQEEWEQQNENNTGVEEMKQ